jgi:hypothetical protein
MTRRFIDIINREVSKQNFDLIRKQPSEHLFYISLYVRPRDQMLCFTSLSQKRPVSDFIQSPEISRHYETKW